MSLGERFGHQSGHIWQSYRFLGIAKAVDMCTEGFCCDRLLVVGAEAPWD